ncbi:hypothetical protein LWI29_010287 [Acer saccharum]|uniref:Bulb-type lectin domain-containing protein n=1 Tax=Acer saccharum TaxID=4024 RepID=A0AA39T5V2_ACESA|nr:hypothetical protein LWI29_010287 [Acer saccharum]
MHRDHFPLMNCYYYFIIIFFVLSTSLTTAQQRQSNISRGSSLTPTKTSSWLSKSGLYAFGFYQRGNGYYSVGVFLAGIQEKTVVWTANRDDPPISGNATLLFTATDGRLVLQTPQGQETNIADISQTVSYASMLDTGNFVLRNSDGDIMWQSFAHPTDTLLPTQPLPAGMQLISSASKTDQSSGTFGLYMQHDGNLVQYPTDAITTPTAYWASGTYVMGDKMSLNLDEDGNLYLLNATGFNVMNITTSGVYATKGSIYLLRIDWDGLFRLYSHNLGQSSRWSVLYNSTADRCAPRGLCGLNSFCVSNDLEPGCSCLPGFAPVIQGNWTSGCERNFTAESCKNKGRNYTIRAEDNTNWQDVSYSVQSEISKEDCRQACLVDCNCEAALYENGQCKKQRLPLKYGRRSSQSGSIAFVKVEETSESSTGMLLPTREGKKGIRAKIIIIIICLFVSLLVVNVVILGVIHHRYRASSYRRISYNGNIGFCGDIAPRSFSYAELEVMTDGFKEEIGSGASGTVYKGTIKNDGKNLFFVLSISSLAMAQQTKSNISRGSSLTPTKTSSWLSKSGLYAFGFYQRGNGYSVGVFLAGIPEKTVVWTAN